MWRRHAAVGLPGCCVACLGWSVLRRHQRGLLVLAQQLPIEPEKGLFGE